MKKSARISGFFNLSRQKKLKIVKNFANLNAKEVKIIEKGILPPIVGDRISENVIGSFSLPYSIAVNFLINQKEYFVPMVTEEPSVVAAACNGAKLMRDGGGIIAKNIENLMIGQIYITDLKNTQIAKKKILKVKQKILKFANNQDFILKKMGGGAKDLEIKVLKKTKIGPVLRIHLLVDVKDAMGANIVNTMLENIAPLIEKTVKVKPLLKIVSNLAEKRTVEVKAIITKNAFEKEGFIAKEIIKKIVKASVIAEADIYRAVTNNKGILNGMTAVALATGNDCRALEAGAHGFAAKTGTYKPLAIWKQNKKGDLVGIMTLPITVGVVGGIIKTHALSKISLKILNVKTAQGLAKIIASVGLAQNLGALRALVSEGIQSGHMELHAKNIAVTAGATGKMVQVIAKTMIEKGKINVKTAQQILRGINGKK